MTRPALFGIIIVLLAIISPTTTIADDYDDEDIDLPYVEIKTSTDFSALGERARASDMIIMLQMSASYCDYCELLEEEIIKPMLRSGDYTETVFIRKIEIDSYYSITGFKGEQNSPDKIAADYKILVTPTLLFLDGDGNEVAKRILGVNSLDFYGGYVDDAIDEGLQRIH
jgi:thioredoxin-related protein